MHRLERESIQSTFRFDFQRKSTDKSSQRKLCLKFPVFRGACHFRKSLNLDGKGICICPWDDSTPLSQDSTILNRWAAGRPENVDAREALATQTISERSMLRIKTEQTVVIPSWRKSFALLALPSTDQSLCQRTTAISITDLHWSTKCNLFWGESWPDAFGRLTQTSPKRSWWNSI